MKKLFLILGLAVILIASAPKPPQPPTWSLQWVDNFDFFDSNRWYDHDPEWQGPKPACFCPPMARIADGYLFLDVWYCPWWLPPEWTYALGAYKSKSTFLYGAFEARIKGIVADSVSSGFWMYKHEPTHWTEIGILEAWAGKAGWEKAYHRAIFRWLPEPVVRDDSWKEGINLADWHIYRLEWTASELKWYIDGVLISTKVNEHWTQALNLLLSVQIYPDWLPLPSPSLLPKSMVVDWIKVYKKN